jgi:hypothetical protein
MYNHLLAFWNAHAPTRYLAKQLSLKSWILRFQDGLAQRCLADC